MPPTYLGRSDPARMLNDALQRIERLERRNKESSSAAGNGSVTGIISRARANTATLPTINGYVFAFSGYSTDTTFEWSNVAELKGAVGALAFDADDHSIISTSKVLVGVTASGFITLSGTPLSLPQLILQIVTTGGGNQIVQADFPVNEFPAPSTGVFGPVCVSWHGLLRPGDKIALSIHPNGTVQSAPNGYVEIDVCGLNVT